MEDIGIGILGLLTIALIVLRITGLVHWSWWWVIAPFWIPAGVVAAVILVLLLIEFLVAAFSSHP